MAQQMLSTTVRAHQAGISRREYRAQQDRRKRLRIPYPYNPMYELRGEYRPFRNGERRLVWFAWQLTPQRRVKARRVHEIHQSTNPAEVVGDLSELLRGV